MILKVSLATVFVVLLTAPRVIDACCSASGPGGFVNIANQEILVTWDPQTRIEHFVRRATFRGGEKTKDFGFLVPTPAKPELAEAKDSVFEELWRAIQPEIRYQDKYDYTFTILPAAMKVGLARDDAYPEARIDARVRVLGEAKVAGYDATILEASDASALTEWLGANGYSARPEITDWVAPYIASQWKVTAFKYSHDESAATRRDRIGTGAIRMTFPTDRPLFPYRVPSDQRNGTDTLRVYYVGPERAEGTLGDKASPWRKDLKFANEIPAMKSMLDGAIPGSAPGTWLTAFEDHRWPGGAEDLYFAPSAEKSPVIPPPIIRYTHKTIYIPVDLAVVVLLAGAGIWMWRRRRA